MESGVADKHDFIESREIFLTIIKVRRPTHVVLQILGSEAADPAIGFDLVEDIFIAIRREFRLDALRRIRPPRDDSVLVARKLLELRGISDDLLDGGEPMFQFAKPRN